MFILGSIIEHRKGKRPSRLDVMALDGKLAQLSALTDEERAEWIEAFDAEVDAEVYAEEEAGPPLVPDPPATSASSASSSVASTAAGSSEPEEVLDPALLSSAWAKVLNYLRGGEANAKQIKCLFDNLGSGKRGEVGVPVAEVAQGLARIGAPLTIAELAAWLKGTDVNKDGKISLAEFTQAVSKQRAALEKKTPEAASMSVSSSSSLTNSNGAAPNLVASKVWAILKAHLVGGGDGALAGLGRVFESSRSTSQASGSVAPSDFLSGLHVLGVDWVGGGLEGPGSASAVAAEKAVAAWCAKSSGRVTLAEVLKECGVASMPTPPPRTNSVAFQADPRGQTPVGGSAEALTLESAMKKLLKFIQADKNNAVALSTVFVRQERLEKSRGLNSSGGLPIEVLMAEFKKLNVGFTEAEAKEFLAHFDRDHDGRLTLVEFTEVIAGSAWRRPSSTSPRSKSSEGPAQAGSGKNQGK